ncbi:hypothetical protein RJ495_000721 [Pluralibacter gergoviae]|nr:hypothetical protein [Pluralibacter gergoviae]
MGKNGFNPWADEGVQRFEHLGAWAWACRWGYSLDRFEWGDKVFFETADGQWWLGTVERDRFTLIVREQLPSVMDGLFYLHENVELEDDQQWELPF